MSSDTAPQDSAIRIPVVEERLRVSKERVETGRVTVTSTVESQNVAILEQLVSTSISIERVPIDRLVDVAPDTRTEGNRMIVPVTEEVVVKRIRVIEEVHLIREDATSTFDQQVALRRMNVSVARSQAPEVERS